MRQHLIVAWRSGFRSRSFHALFILGLLAMGGAYGASLFSGRQPATVALDVGISGVRFIVLLMMVFWCQELVAREIERRTVFLALSYPVPRWQYLIGRFLGVLALAAVAVAGLGVLLSGFAFLANIGYVQGTPIDLGTGLWGTLLLILFDVAVIGAFTILVATISTTPVLPLALGFAFAVAARSLGPTMEFLGDKSRDTGEGILSLGPAVDLIKWILPDLSRLDIRTAALYGNWPSPAATALAITTCLAYSVVLLACSVLFFERRQFT